VKAMRQSCVRAAEGVAVTTFGLLILALIQHLAHDLARVWILIPGAIIGYLAGDLVSGFVHWWCDNFFREDSLLIGKLLIRPFREHHRDPLAIVGHGFLELTGNSCMAMLVPLAAVVWLGDEVSALPATAFLFLCLALFTTNLFHKWAHASAVPHFVRWLQKRRLILTPGRHRIHHLNGYTGAYCITSGWMNGLLDRLLGAQ